MQYFLDESKSHEGLFAYPLLLVRRQAASFVDSGVCQLLQQICWQLQFLGSSSLTHKLIATTRPDTLYKSAPYETRPETLLYKS